MKTLSDHLKLLGTHQRDPITNLTGFVVSVSFDINGCVMAAIKPQLDKDGKIPDAVWVDVDRVESTGEKQPVRGYDFSQQRQQIPGPAEKPTK